MHNMTFSLFKIFFKNIFSLRAFIEGFRKGKKECIKNISLLLIFAYCIAVFGGIYSLIMINSYSVFESIHQEKLFIVAGFIISTFAVLFFGFISVSTNYFTGNGEEQFLSMPLTSKNIFGAKFGISFITDALLGFCIFAVTGGIYGFKNHLLANPLFYLGIIITAATIGLICISVIYLLFIIVLYLLPSLRKRNILNKIATLFIILFAIGYSIISTKISTVLDNRTSFEMVSTVIESLNRTKAVSFLLFCADTANGNILSILFMAAVSVTVLFVFVPLLGRIYIKTLNGFTDIKTKHLDSKETEKVFAKEIKSTSVFKSLLMRDIRTVLREPAFFSNGPLLLILLPLIIIITSASSIYGKTDDIIETINIVFAQITPDMLETVKFYIIISCSAITVFLGNSTCIAATCFSREGKCLKELKAMPIDNKTLVFVKFVHSFIYIIVAFAISSITLIALILFLNVPFSLATTVQILITVLCMSSSVSAFLIFIDMAIDTVNPKLNWDNPMAAFKQNINSIISIFITIGVIAICAGIIYLLSKNLTAIFFLTALFAAVSFVTGKIYFRYAEKKIPLM